MLKHSDSDSNKRRTACKKGIRAIRTVPLFFLSLLLVVSLTSLWAESGKMIFKKEPLVTGDSATEDIKKKVHPAQSLFPKRSTYQQGTRSENFERLLVLLIDFQEDDDPKTTGNGKFLLQPDPDYPISLGAPPHDYQFFHHHLEAMRYYYLAASLGSFNLQFDIYPQEGGERFAYTLPNEMAYYNPGMQDADLFVKRAEEYFQDAFQVADSYGEIDFSKYEHYMFIHAGSDWQHDVYGDTPHDLPSFFISVAEGKEARLNDGNVVISTACNVPETISQDGNYGVINGVLFHEFGHSIGFVDLYNTRNAHPGVGYWDIMDSGGSIKVFFQGEDGNHYPIEGTIPTLPGAWHRLIAFGNYYKDKGFFQEITDFEQNAPISIVAASSIPKANESHPYIVKMPLNDKEYVLFENRTIDPDNDGGIAIKGAYPLTPGEKDYRVVLHPIALDDDDLLSPTYEYDWLLPGWINEQGHSFGGGIIAWHVDEKVIYDEGRYFSDGTFYNNFQNNSVNAYYNNRGVKIIEADNIEDIGNIDSWYWYGTEYEPFFRYKPRLQAEYYIDDSGRTQQAVFFNGWSAEEHNSTLCSTSAPALRSKKGHPSLFSIYDISGASRLMTLKYRFEPFEASHLIANIPDVVAIGTLGKYSFPPFDRVIPVFTKEGVYLFKKIRDDNEWLEFYFDLDHYPSHQPITTTNSDGKPIFYVPANNRLLIIEDDGFSTDIKELQLESTIVESPLIVETNDEVLIFIPTSQEIIQIDGNTKEIVDFYPYKNAKLTFNGEALFAVSEGNVCQIDFSAQNSPANRSNTSSRASSQQRNNLLQTNIHQRTTPNDGEEYFPISYRDLSNPDYSKVFIQNEDGNIYSFSTSNGQIEELFTLSPYTKSKPTQLSFVQTNNQPEQTTNLFFAADNLLFSLDLNGSLLEGYPKELTDNFFAPYTFPRIISTADDEIIAILMVEKQGYLAYNLTSEKTLPELSMSWNSIGYNDLFYYDEESKDLSFYLVDGNFNIYDNVLYSNVDANAIIWNGYRHNNCSSIEGINQVKVDPTTTLSAYSFPNPVSSNEVRVRVNGVKNCVELKIFDISGKVLYDNKFNNIVTDYYDARINIDKLSSGVYFGIVETGGKRTTFNLAVEK